MLQGELDHLADLHELLLEAADVLVGDRGGKDLALADGLLLHLDERVVVDLHDAFRLRLDDHEREGASHERDPWDDNDVPLRDGALQEAPLHEVLDSLAEGYLVPLTDDRRDRDSLALEDLGLPDLDLVPEAHADVPAHEPVDADDALPLVLLHDPEELRGCRLLPDDLDDLAHVHSEGDAGLRVHPGPAQPDVGLGRFGHLELNALGHGRFQGSRLISILWGGCRWARALPSCAARPALGDLAGLVHDEIVRLDRGDSTVRADPDAIADDESGHSALEVHAVPLDPFRGQVSAAPQEPARGLHADRVRADPPHRGVAAELHAHGIRGEALRLHASREAERVALDLTFDPEAAARDDGVRGEVLPHMDGSARLELVRGHGAIHPNGPRCVERVRADVPLERAGARDLRRLRVEVPAHPGAPGGLELPRPHGLSRHDPGAGDLDDLVAELDPDPGDLHPAEGSPHGPHGLARRARGYLRGPGNRFAN